MKLCGHEVGGQQPLFLIAGTCVIESEQMTMDVAGRLKEMTDKLGIQFIYKSSFDKANRTSSSSPRGIGISEALKIFSDIKSKLGCPVLTDIHEAGQCAEVATVVDVLQIPAFLCRQTDLLFAAGESGAAINVKKGQFLAPWDMANVIKKLEESGNKNI